MPILTPAYPSMNSSFNVSTHTLAVMKDELKRALGLVQDILNTGGADWAPLFAPSDFFAVHQHYLAVDIFTTTEDDEQAWCGFCESRIRKLVESLAYIPQLCRIRTFTKKFPLSFVEAASPSAPPAPQDAPSDQAPPPPVKPTKFGVCFFVGFDVDRRQLRGREVSIDNSVDYFKHNDLYRWNKRTAAMDVKITPVVWKNLPECVFEDMGGRQVARAVRREFMKKKKDEEKAAEGAATGATATGTSSGEDAPVSAKDTQSQDTDGTCDEDNASATEDTEDMPAEPASAVAPKVSPPLPPGSPNPASDGADDPTSSAATTTHANKPEFSTPVKAKLPAPSGSPSAVAGASPLVASMKRERDSSVSAAGTPISKPALTASSAPGTPLAGAPTSAPVKELPRAPIIMAPPAPVSSPRKRRKMKISFGKLK